MVETGERSRASRVKRAADVTSVLMCGNTTTMTVGNQSEKVLFVSNSTFLAEKPGGVQKCTREYMKAILAAGLDVAVCPIPSRSSWFRRLSYRLVSNPYTLQMSQTNKRTVMQAVRRERPDIIFLNQVNLALLATTIKKVTTPSPKIVLLSHGAEITDLVYSSRALAQLPLTCRLRPTNRIALGTVLYAETMSRKCCDAVIVLSEADVSFERWLGARNVSLMPRTIQERPIEWRPKEKRLGYLGTLDHAPNLDGLVCVLDALSRLHGSDIRVRVIGGPERIGTWLAERFRVVDYLGSLDEDEVRSEASSWTAFVHPLFNLSRGCSTKLAVAIGWRIPIVTTSLGRRGYEWRLGELQECDSPIKFVQACVELFEGERASHNRAGVQLVADSSPSLSDSGARIRAVIDNLA